MSTTEFLIGRSGLDLQDDFYPDDLPQEWRFDYYSTLFRALSLPIDTDEDFDSIFEEMDDVEQEFELVISIEADDLSDSKKLLKRLSGIANNKDSYTLFCELDEKPDDQVMKILSDYDFCLQSANELNIDSKHKTALDKHLHFNNLPVFYFSKSWDEKQIRSYLEQMSAINTKTILICKYAESETLNKIRIISELLGF